ncbi:MAG: Bcr/CflA family efflux MFS transporter [Burkholderiaceae bacterium]|nr:MAG: Bcr/CflA family efflux MFS transporter [Burkholderiaceae bacterium]
MHADLHAVWKAPRWALAVLLACLGMLGPFAIDTYLPAFSGIAQSLHATPLQMQQTLSAYLAGFAFMNLFHGALADALGRRPVVLGGVALFTLASVGCALAPSIEVLVLCRAMQGFSTGAGIVVSRAVIRDLFPPEQAQRMMSQVTLFFGVAPVIAPIIGGFIFTHFDWHGVFWALALIGVMLWVANWRLLPETLKPELKQPLQFKALFQGYREVVGDRRFLLLAIASGVPFNGMFLYVLSAPVFLGEHLHLGPTEYFWFFMCSIGGIMGGAAISGRLAGKMRPARQIRQGFIVMAVVSVANVALNMVMPPTFPWTMVPVGLFALGWSLNAAVITLLVLELFPHRRGMASSLQAVLASVSNAIVAGAVAPAVMHSTLALAWASAGIMLVGLVSWLWVKRDVKALL